MWEAKQYVSVKVCELTPHTQPDVTIPTKQHFLFLYFLRYIVQNGPLSPDGNKCVAFVLTYTSHIGFKMNYARINLLAKALSSSQLGGFKEMKLHSLWLERNELRSKYHLAGGHSCIVGCVVLWACTCVHVCVLCALIVLALCFPLNIQSCAASLKIRCSASIMNAYSHSCSSCLPISDASRTWFA